MRGPWHICSYPTPLKKGAQKGKSEIRTNHKMRWKDNMQWLCCLSYLTIKSLNHTSIIIHVNKTIIRHSNTNVDISTFIIWLSSLSGLYRKWRTLIGCPIVQKVFRTDRLVLVGKRPSWFEEKQARFRYVLQKIYKNKLRKKKINLLNDNFKLKTRWIDAEKQEIIGKSKRVNLSRWLV